MAGLLPAANDGQGNEGALGVVGGMARSAPYRGGTEFARDNWALVLFRFILAWAPVALGHWQGQELELKWNSDLARLISPLIGRSANARGSTPPPGYPDPKIVFKCAVGLWVREAKNAIPYLYRKSANSCFKTNSPHMGALWCVACGDLRPQEKNHWSVGVIYFRFQIGLLRVGLHRARLKAPGLLQ